MDTIAIVGLGLIGGSFGLALREAGFQGRILGVSSREYVHAALDVGAITQPASLKEAASQADVIYLSQTIDRILDTIERLSEFDNLDCLVTDAGSTKRAITAHAAKFLPSVSFLGGHPMTGKEQRGVHAAEAALFRARPYVLTGCTPESSKEAEFRSLLQRIGARVIDLTPEEHDRAVAFTSHLPQLLSTALAKSLARQEDRAFLQVFGPGLLDMTRLALSSSDLWESILRTNADEICSAINEFATTLGSLGNLSDNGVNLKTAFADAAAFARQLRDGERN